MSAELLRLNVTQLMYDLFFFFFFFLLQDKDLVSVYFVCSCEYKE